jgi:hypothetical protein
MSSANKPTVSGQEGDRCEKVLNFSNSIYIHTCIILTPLNIRKLLRYKNIFCKASDLERGRDIIPQAK